MMPKATATSSEKLWPCNCTQPHKQSYHDYTSSYDTSPVPQSTDADNKIFIITPTYHRDTQKIDLTSMCHTLMNVPNVIWIIIEDAPKPTNIVTQLIQRCRVDIVHLIAHTSAAYKVKKGSPHWSKPRGVEQRNAGLNWLRQKYSADNCNGVVYFGDDDNKYDLRLFDDVSYHLYML